MNDSPVDPFLEPRLPALPRDRDDDQAPAAVAARLALAERSAGRALPRLAGEPVPYSEARGNVENIVGFAQVPVGLAGPLVCDTTSGRAECYLPLATNEGALVASVSRGTRLLAAGGGARARVVREGLTQNPVLVYRDARAAGDALELARGSFERFAKLVAGTTNHGRLVEVRPSTIGRRLVLSLVFTTGDAIGINMAARATDLCMRDLAERTGALEAWVHGQDVEKRANSRALVEGRGRSVVCDVVVPRADLERIARTTPEALKRAIDTYRVGFAELGTHNWTVQSANVIAALFVACGQDVAYLVECATGQLDLDVTESGDLYAGVWLPSMLVGTVGGGSGKGTAAECLALLGCTARQFEGPGAANRFAELIAAAVLAGDLSLMAAFCTSEFVAAHERLGRNRPPGGPPERRDAKPAGEGDA